MFLLICCSSILYTCKLKEIPPLPTADFTLSHCDEPLGDSCLVTFINNSINGDSYYWDFGDGSYSTLFEPEDKYVVYHCVHRITLTTKNSSGEDQISKTLEIGTPQPHASFEFGNDCVAGCESGVQFVNLSQCANSYEWNIESLNFTSSEKNPTWYPDEAGDYNVQLISRYVNFDLFEEPPYPSDTTTLQIHIYHQDSLVEANAEFWSDTIGVCPNCLIEFHNISMNNIETSYLWDFGDGESSTTSETIFTHEYDVQDEPPGTVVDFDVTLIASNFFSALDPEVTDTAYGQVQIATSPITVAQFDMSEDTCYLNGDNCLISFTNTSVNAELWEWDFGDGVGSSSEHSPIYEYTDEGTYPVSLTVFGSDEQQDETTQSLVVLDGCGEDWCCGDNLVDDRDPDNPIFYSTVEINGVCIMAENLKYTALEGSGTYGDQSGDETCIEGEIYYEWGHAQEACPAGWHIPTDEDLSNMFGTLDFPDYPPAGFEVGGSLEFDAIGAGYAINGGPEVGCHFPGDFFFWAIEGNAKRWWSWSPGDSEFLNDDGDLVEDGNGQTCLNLRCVKD